MRVPFHSHTLQNGLQLIGETSPSARSVALGFFVRTGARDETGDVSGVTHFLEHMVFKGTPRRSALEVNADFDRIGAQYNAFTSEEHTVFYAAILPEYLPRAVDILADILRPSLRGEDFDMEKKVIIEEIGMYDDQPMWSAYDHAKRAYFGDHPGSRLYWALLDPGLAESADASFHEYEGTGSFFTSFSGEPARTEENLAIVLDLLAQAQREGVTEEELRQAKNKILSRVVRG